MNIKFTILFSCICFISLAQKHDNIWILGYQGGSQSPSGDAFGISVLDFSTGELVISENEEIEMNMDAACISYSDSEGNLLYYSNGIYIEDHSFQTMLNGEDLNDWLLFGQTLPQGVLALPFPGDENKSILFSEEKGYIPGWSLEVIGLYYSIIDHEGNNGLGEVVLKNEPLIIDTLKYGKLTATKHANGRDWWMVINESHTNRFYKLLLDQNGITIYDNQTIGLPIEEEGLGQAVFSSDGSTFVMFSSINAAVGQYVEIYDFDRCSGLLSNHIRMHIESSGAGGIAISPNSRFLYISSYENIFQYDLWANDIEATKETVAVYDGFLSPLPTRFFLAQLAPDGKIYINCTNGTDVLHVIHSPNEQGLACNVEQHGIQLPTFNSFSLPNNPNYRLEALEGSSCDTIVTSLMNTDIVEIRLFPNPVYNILTVSFDRRDLHKVCLFSSLGKKLYEEEIIGFEGALNIDVSGFPSGIYLFTIYTEGGKVKSEEVMISH